MFPFVMGKIMDVSAILRQIDEVSQDWARSRRARQLRTTLVKADFERLELCGYLKLTVPIVEGGLWDALSTAVRPICAGLRSLSSGDSSIALVAAMHPAVLSYWLVSSPDLKERELWQPQFKMICETVKSGNWWGTITSEPGSGGDIGKTSAKATKSGPGGVFDYRLSGDKHFGSGSGVTSYMVTTAIPDGEEHADWFFVDMRGVPWDGSRGVKCLAEWDGQGMKATQSHAFAFEEFPATRLGWPGHLSEIVTRTGGFIGCLFASVIVGIVDAAMQEAKIYVEGLDPRRAFEAVEWARAQNEYWLIKQAQEGMIRAAEQQLDSREEVLHGKIAISELAEQVLLRLCKVIGGGSFARRSPFGNWFEDVRALGFLRPPWGLAFQTLIDRIPRKDPSQSAS